MTALGQVFSWDITKLAGPVKGKYFDAYVMIDIYSRYIVGAVVHAHESGPLAVEMMKEIFGIHGVPQVVHAVRGTSMTSKTVAALLSDLEVTRSHSRPKVSNDNPYSEAWFKTLKYAPTFPERFGALADVRGFLADFVQWYNHEHRHTGIGLQSRRRPLRPGSSQGHRPLRHPGRRQSSEPGTLQHLDPTQNPSTTSLGLDQPTTTSSTSRLTPLGLNRLDKYRQHKYRTSVVDPTSHDDLH